MLPLKSGFAFAAFLTAAILCAHAASAGTQYVYPGEPYSSTSYGANPTYQYNYPAASATTYPGRQFPAANTYPTAQYQPATQYQQPAPQPYQPPAQYQSAQYQASQYQQPAQYQTSQYQQPAQYQQSAPQYQTATSYQPQQYQASAQYQQPAPAVSSGISSLPSYSYNQQLDPRYQPPYNPSGPNNAKPVSTDRPEGEPFMGLETLSGIDLGLQFSYYRYSEPGLGVTETSDDPFLGLNLRGTYVFGGGYFVRGEGRYAFVDIDYQGSGEIDDRSVVNWEYRGLFGKDFLFQQFSLSPYTGFGYRTLFNDNRGTSSDGSAGYRRYNQLYYLPFGAEARTHLDSHSRVEAKLEYDFMLHGLQKSDLADAGFGDPSVKNVQSSGYGLRGELMYETPSWSLGPYFNYWNIDQSKTKLALDNSASTCGGLGTPCTLIANEPGNNTTEVGLQFRYHFF